MFSIKKLIEKNWDTMTRYITLLYISMQVQPIEDQGVLRPIPGLNSIRLQIEVKNHSVSLGETCVQ